MRKENTQRKFNQNFTASCAICKYNAALFKKNRFQCQQENCRGCENEDGSGVCLCEKCYDEERKIYRFFVFADEFSDCIKKSETEEI